MQSWYMSILSYICLSFFVQPHDYCRYLYIPLGGSRRKLLSIWVIFTFVAVWHDLEWQLLQNPTIDSLAYLFPDPLVMTWILLFDYINRKLVSWAWLTCLFFVPEILVKSLSNKFQVQFFRQLWFSRFAALEAYLLFLEVNRIWFQKFAEQLWQDIKFT